MGWFVGMVCLPLLYKHSEYLSEHTWLPYIVLCAFAIVGGVLILCIQRVYKSYIDLFFLLVYEHYPVYKANNRQQIELGKKME